MPKGGGSRGYGWKKTTFMFVRIMLVVYNESCCIYLKLENLDVSTNHFCNRNRENATLKAKVLARQLQAKPFVQPPPSPARVLARPSSKSLSASG